jgi:cell division protein FtsB
MRAAIGLGACVLLFGIAADDHGLRAVIRAEREAERLASRVAELRAENALLRTEAAALRRRDPAAIEREARRTLGLIRPGELVVTPHGR